MHRLQPRSDPNWLEEPIKQLANGTLLASEALSIGADAHIDIRATCRPNRATGILIQHELGKMAPAAIGRSVSLTLISAVSFKTAYRMR